MRFSRFLIVLMFLVAAGIRSAEACSCPPPPPPKESLAGAAAVFTAKVVKIEVDEKGFSKTVTLEVDRAWKGVTAKIVIVSTSKFGTECGYGFVEGMSYLIYADGRDGKLSASLCSRTRPIAAAKDDFAALGEGTKIEDKPSKKE